MGSPPFPTTSKWVIIIMSSSHDRLLVPQTRMYNNWQLSRLIPSRQYCKAWKLLNNTNMNKKSLWLPLIAVCFFFLWFIYWLIGPILFAPDDGWPGLFFGHAFLYEIVLPVAILIGLIMWLFIRPNSKIKSKDENKKVL